jgi:hypothetical protein
MATSRYAIVRLQLDLSAKKKLDDLREKRGMTQVTIMSRLVDWFTTQDDVSQMGVLSRMAPDAFAPVAKKMLGKLARGEKV